MSARQDRRGKFPRALVYSMHDSPQIVRREPVRIRDFCVAFEHAEPDQARGIGSEFAERLPIMAIHQDDRIGPDQIGCGHDRGTMTSEVHARQQARLDMGWRGWPVRYAMESRGTHLEFGSEAIAQQLRRIGTAVDVSMTDHQHRTQWAGSDGRSGSTAGHKHGPLTAQPPRDRRCRPSNPVLHCRYHPVQERQ